MDPITASLIATGITAFVAIAIAAIKASPDIAAALEPILRDFLATSERLWIALTEDASDARQEVLDVIKSARDALDKRR